MPLIERRSFLLATTGGFLSFVVLGLQFRSDPRMSDGVVSGSEMNSIEQAILAYSLIAVFSQIIAAATYAFKSKNKLWVALNIFAWPASFYYGWKVYLSHSNWRRHVK